MPVGDYELTQNIYHDSNYFTVLAKSKKGSNKYTKSHMVVYDRSKHKKGNTSVSDAHGIAYMFEPED